MIALRSTPAFDLGNVCLTTLAKQRMTEQGLDPVTFINRHVHCDWGELSANDRVLNQQALKSGNGLSLHTSLAMKLIQATCTF